MNLARAAVPDDAERIADIRVTEWRESFTDQFTPPFLANLGADPEPFRREIEPEWENLAEIRMVR